MKIFRIKKPLKTQKRQILFVSIAVLIFTQLAWWIIVFLDKVKVVQSLSGQLAGAQGRVELLPSFAAEANHQRFMFLSEAISFGFFVGFGLFMIFRALRNEEHTAQVQKKFIETFTHESRTPLTGLKLKLESLRETYSTDRFLSQECGFLISEVRRLASLFEKVLSIQRFENRDFRLDVVNVAEVLNRVVKRLEPILRERNVEVICECSRNLFVKADFVGLESAIQAVLENSILYNMGAHPKVHLKAFERDTGQSNSVLIQISDNGTGVTEKDREFIFDRFYRGSGHHRIPGTGIGLSIAKEIALAHKGDLKLVSTGSTGSNFQFSLPMVIGDFA